MFFAGKQLENKIIDRGQKQTAYRENNTKHLVFHFIFIVLFNIC